MCREHCTSCGALLQDGTVVRDCGHKTCASDACKAAPACVVCSTVLLEEAVSTSLRDEEDDDAEDDDLISGGIERL